MSRERITGREWRAAGGLRNSACSRRQQGNGRWSYYIERPVLAVDPERPFLVGNRECSYDEYYNAQYGPETRSDNP